MTEFTTNNGSKLTAYLKHNNWEDAIPVLMALGWELKKVAIDPKSNDDFKVASKEAMKAIASVMIGEYIDHHLEEFKDSERFLGSHIPRAREIHRAREVDLEGWNVHEMLIAAIAIGDEFKTPRLIETAAALKPYF